VNSIESSHFVPLRRLHRVTTIYAAALFIEMLAAVGFDCGTIVSGLASGNHARSNDNKADEERMQFKVPFAQKLQHG